MKRYYLAFGTGSHQKTIHPLVEVTTIGRDSSNLIKLPEPSASRNHARVSFWQGSWMVEDLGSANGIIFKGERVEKAYLKSGDSFKIGETAFSLVQREIAKSKDPLRTTLMDLSATIQGLESPVFGEGTNRGPRQLMDVISEIPFFTPLLQTEREKLAEGATMHVFGAGEMIMQEGDPGRSIYVILDGSVKVFVGDHGEKEIELPALGAGEFFGVTSLLTGKPRPHSVATIETTVLVEFSYNCMVDVMKQNTAAKNVLVEYNKAHKHDSQEKRPMA